MHVPAVFELQGIPRYYDWGSRSAIEDMLGIPRSGSPTAELWFGAHPDDPAAVPSLGTTLDELIATDPVTILGVRTADRFGGRLPFLLKVLAAERPLSIQVHPTRDQARVGFAAQDAAGVLRDAPNRSYRDANHKPELVCALTDFEALCGFRPVEQISAVLERFALPELDGLSAVLHACTTGTALRAPFEYLLTLPEPGPIVAAITARARELAEADPDFGAARAVLLAAEHFPADIGVALTLLLNYVVLRQGQAIYLGAGNVHAYLRGVGVEIMANSDNVLRCGLTPKHIDIPELLKVSDFSPLEDPRWYGVGAEPLRFEVPVGDFALERRELDGVEVLGAADAPRIVLILGGSCEIRVGEVAVCVSRGGGAYVLPGVEARLTGHGLLFVAGVGAGR